MSALTLNAKPYLGIQKPTVLRLLPFNEGVITCYFVGFGELHVDLQPKLTLLRPRGHSRRSRLSDPSQPCLRAAAKILLKYA